MRGGFAILGIGFITVYFSVFLQTQSFVLMLIIYFIGLLLIIIDGKVLNDGTLAAIGLVVMLTSVALASPTFTAGIYAFCVVLIVAGSAFIFFALFIILHSCDKTI